MLGQGHEKDENYLLQVSNDAMFITTRNLMKCCEKKVNTAFGLPDRSGLQEYRWQYA